MGKLYDSWGRYPRLQQAATRLHWRHEPLPLSPQPRLSSLPFGNGRSYGDSCLNGGGVLLDTRGLDRFIAFDPATGILRCEAGVLLGDILALVVPHGWFLPVVPGTQLVTVGGAIANDVHGKNHHRAGTFGCHVRRFELLRSDGRRLMCAGDDNPDWFRATIGGLGLTGVILWADLALKRSCTPAIEVETLRFPDLEGFFALSAASNRDFEYTVAWLDGLARGRHLGRGVLLRANHVTARGAKLPRAPKHRIDIAMDLPVSLVNRLSVRAFNSLYYHQHPRSPRRAIVHYAPFFFP